MEIAKAVLVALIGIGLIVLRILRYRKKYPASPEKPKSVE